LLSIFNGRLLEAFGRFHFRYKLENFLNLSKKLTAVLQLTFVEQFLLYFERLSGMVAKIVYERHK